MPNLIGPEPRFIDTLSLKNEDKEIIMGKPRFTEEFKIDAMWTCPVLIPPPVLV